MVFYILWQIPTWDLLNENNIWRSLCLVPPVTAADGRNSHPSLSNAWASRHVQRLCLHLNLQLQVSVPLAVATGCARRKSIGGQGCQSFCRGPVWHQSRDTPAEWRPFPRVKEDFEDEQKTVMWCNRIKRRGSYQLCHCYLQMMWWKFSYHWCTLFDFVLCFSTVVLFRDESFVFWNRKINVFVSRDEWNDLQNDLSCHLCIFLNW